MEISESTLFLALSLTILQRGPENPSGNLVFSFEKTKTFVGTDFFTFYQFSGEWYTKPLV